MFLLCFASACFHLKENIRYLRSFIGLLRSILIVVNIHDVYDLYLFLGLSLRLVVINIHLLEACCCMCMVWLHDAWLGFMSLGMAFMSDVGLICVYICRYFFNCE